MGVIITIDEMIDRTADLPVIPAVALRIMHEADSNTTSASQIAMLLARDPALASRVLRLANSAYYGLSGQVFGLKEAVVVLGLRCVKNLALVAASYPWLSKPLHGYGLEPKDLWMHSHGTAVAAMLVAQRSGRLRDDEAFTAGLLHDIGKLAMNVWLERKTEALIQLSSLNGWSFVECERTVLGYDHGQVGGRLAERWNLPLSVIDSARYHHEPDARPDPSLIVDAVHLGDYLASVLGFGLGADGLQYALQPNTLVRLGLHPQDIDRIADDLERERRLQAESFEEIVA